MMEEELSKLCGRTRCVSDFEKLKEIGEGTYGKVCKGGETQFWCGRRAAASCTR